MLRRTSSFFKSNTLLKEKEDVTCVVAAAPAIPVAGRGTKKNTAAFQTLRKLLRPAKQGRVVNSSGNPVMVTDILLGPSAVATPEEEVKTPIKQTKEYPKRGDLRTTIYRPLPIISPIDAATVDPASIITEVLSSLSSALTAGNVDAAKDCFCSDQCYWRDQLAFTYHMRTFKDEAVPQALVERAKVAQAGAFNLVPGTARLVPAGPTLTWIDCFFFFETSAPASICSGMLQLLPTPDGKWKIWTFATWLKDLKDFPEKEELLKEPTKRYDAEKETVTMETDVFIIGAGNAGLVLASRLKAFGIDYLAIDRAEKIGDNWALRYDSVKFHVPKAFAETPYLKYEESLPNLMSRDDLANQCIRFAKAFDLNVLFSTTIKSTKQDPETKKWTMVLNTPHGERTVVAKHVVQSTGVGSSMSYVPKLEKEGEYKGVVLHSSQYKNAEELKKKGVKSVIVVGSGNTAFDVLQDCHDAGFTTTVIQRSKTYIMPVEYLNHTNGVGMYDVMPAEIADAVTMAGPIAVGGQLLSGVHAMQAAAEPERYSKAREAGLQVETMGDLMHNLIERCGGHYLDLGATNLIADKKVSLVSGVSPISYTSTGLLLSDGSSLSADAIIFCTGFADKNLREISASILGEGGAEVADRMDSTWALDTEGELRGLYKRQLKLDNYWLFAGFTSQQRYYSRALALQLKASLEGILPEAYRETPEPEGVAGAAH